MCIKQWKAYLTQAQEEHAHDLNYIKMKPLPWEEGQIPLSDVSKPPLNDHSHLEFYRGDALT